MVVAHGQTWIDWIDWRVVCDIIIDTILQVDANLYFIRPGRIIDVYSVRLPGKLVGVAVSGRSNTTKVKKRAFRLEFALATCSQAAS